MDQALQDELEIDTASKAAAEKSWLKARDQAVKQAVELMDLGVHKELVNRLLIAAWRQKNELFNKHYELQKRWRQSLVPGDKVRWYGDSEPIPREIVSLGERVTIKTDHTQELTHIDQIHPWTAEDEARYQDQQRWKKVFAEVKSASNKYPPRDRALLERLEAALGLADAGH